LFERQQRAGSGLVVGCEGCGEVTSTPQEALHALVTAGLYELAVDHQRLVVRDSGFTQRRPVAVEAVAGVLHAQVASQMSDTRMTKVQEVAGRDVAAAHVVDEDTVVR